MASTLPPWNKEAYAEARLPRNAVAWLKALSDTKIGRLDEARSTRPLHFLVLIHRSAWRDCLENSWQGRIGCFLVVQNVQEGAFSLGRLG